MTARSTGSGFEPHVATSSSLVLDSATKSLWQILDETAADHHDSPAVVFGEDSLSYSGLVGRALRCARRLSELGVGLGTRVVVQFHSSADWAVLHYALARLGAVTVPVNLSLEARELEHVVRVAEPEHIITIETYRDVDLLGRFRTVYRDFVDGVTTVAGLPALRSVSTLPVLHDGRLDRSALGVHRIFGNQATVPLDAAGTVSADDPAYVIFTSGSTGSPKPAVLSHRALSAAGTGYAEALRFTAEDRLLVMQPTFHVTGPMFLVIPHRVGGAAHLIGHFEAARALDEIESQRCTATVTFPTNMTKLMAEPSFPQRDLSSFRKVVMGGTGGYLDHVNKVFDLDLIGTIYGSTESGGLVTATDPEEPDVVERLRTNGSPIDGVEVRIVDPESGETCAPDQRGEICFRGIVRFDGYLPGAADIDESIDAEGFFHSGDYGYVDELGRLFYRGRYKMMIKTGGENVSELEVELFLEEEFEQIEVAQVVGVPDDTWGEVIVAFVQLRGFPANAEAQDYRDSCRGRIAGFKIPKLFIEVAPGDWPVAPNGRLDKQALRAMARSETSSR